MATGVGASGVIGPGETTSKEEANLADHGRSFSPVGLILVAYDQSARKHVPGAAVARTWAERNDSGVAL